YTGHINHRGELNLSASENEEIIEAECQECGKKKVWSYIDVYGW
ncbi:unnamed protein product, partial [marine sediment metagenome]